MILLPGPSVMLTIGHSIRHGTRPALLTVAGTSTARLRNRVSGTLVIGADVGPRTGQAVDGEPAKRGLLSGRLGRSVRQR